MKSHHHLQLQSVGSLILCHDFLNLCLEQELFLFYAIISFLAPSLTDFSIVSLSFHFRYFLFLSMLGKRIFRQFHLDYYVLIDFQYYYREVHFRPFDYFRQYTGPTCEVLVVLSGHTYRRNFLRVHLIVDKTYRSGTFYQS